MPKGWLQQLGENPYLREVLGRTAAGVGGIVDFAGQAATTVPLMVADPTGRALAQWEQQYPAPNLAGQARQYFGLKAPEQLPFPQSAAALSSEFLLPGALGAMLPMGEAAIGRINRAARGLNERGTLGRPAPVPEGFDPESAVRKGGWRGEPGRPIRVYHGTTNEFEQFDPGRAGYGMYGPGYYFTENPAIAGGNVSKFRPSTGESMLRGEDTGLGYATGSGEFVHDRALEASAERKVADYKKAMETAPNNAWRKRWKMLSVIAESDLENLRAKVPRERPNVRAAYLNIKRPLDMDKPMSIMDAADFADGLRKHAAKIEAQSPRVANAYRDMARGIDFDNAHGMQTTGTWLWSKAEDIVDSHLVLSSNPEEASQAKGELYRLLKDVGYDGITHIGGGGGRGPEHRVWIAFDPKQIISAYEAPKEPIGRAGRVAAAAQAFNKRLGQRGAVGPKPPEVPAAAEETGPIWRNPVLESLGELKQEKVSPDQLRAHLIKHAGASDQAKWMGLDEWMKGRKSVTRGEVEQFVRENQLEVEEKVLGKGVDVDTDPKAQQIKGRLEELEGRNARLTWGQWPAEDRAAHEAIMAEYGNYLEEAAQPAQYDQPELSLPGGRDYREMLFKTPINVKPKRAAQALANDIMQSHPEWTPLQGREDPITGALVRLDSARRGPGVDPQLRQEYGALYDRLSREHSKFGEDVYRPPHFEGEPNLYAHMRFDTREDMEGTTGIHVAELQSDWSKAQRKARKAEVARVAEAEGITKKEADAKVPKDWGWRDQAEIERLQEQARAAGTNWREHEERLRELMSELRGRYPELYQHGSVMDFHAGLLGMINDVDTTTPKGRQWWLDQQQLGRMIEEDRRLMGEHEVAARRVTTAENLPSRMPEPLQKNWPMMLMKRAIRWAVDHGYDQVTWDTGETQADRYNKWLRDIRAVAAEPRGREEQWYAYLGENRERAPLNREQADEVRALLGNREPSPLPDNAPGKWWDLEREPLTIGGGKFQKFYDEEIRNDLNKFVKKWGAEVDSTEIPLPGAIRWRIEEADDGGTILYDVGRYGNENRIVGYFPSDNAAFDYVDSLGKGSEERAAKVHRLKITPALRRAAKRGMELSQAASVSMVG